MRAAAGWLLIVALGAIAMPVGHGAEQLSIEEELAKLERGEVPELEIAGARYRIAVFSYEDPDRTGLGNTFAAFVSRQVLTGTPVSSLGVLRYEGALGPTQPGELGYFDKITRLSESQRPVLSVWGVIRRSGNQIVVDTYAQLPADIIDSAFTWRLLMPERMNGGVLVARLGPDRFQVLRFEMSASDAGAMRAAGEALDVVRSSPASTASVVGTLPQRKVYRILGRENDWIRVAIEGGQSGWVPASGTCGRACESVAAASTFLSGLVMAMERPRAPRAESLAADARVLASQLDAIAALNDGSIDAIERGSLPALERWLASAAGSARSIPGGAAVANLRAVSQMALALKVAARDGSGEHGSPVATFNRLELDRETVESIAYELASASLDDPRNTDVLQNLAVLFDYAGDADRADLARSLAAQQAPPPR